MSSITFNRIAGESAPLGRPTADTLPEDPTALLVHDGVPEWITNPITGARETVTGVEDMPKGTPCASCKAPLPATRALIATRTGFEDQELVVFECPHQTQYIVGARAKR